MKRYLLGALIFAILTLTGALFWQTFEESHALADDTDYSIGTRPESKRYFHVKEGQRNISFNLHDPETAPPEYRDQVVLGRNLMLQTGQYAADYVGNRLSCVNCHFCAGNTTGGHNGSISLVGVPTKYPQFSKRDKRTITLEDRIENCFMRSLNGKPLPKDSKEMKALLAYLHWISQDVMSFKELPWLGLREIKSSHQPDANAGSKVYSERCAICHSIDGEGSEQAPPLWGIGSFNDGAGMNMQPKLSAFVYDNMPYQEPDLTVEEAVDVAAYIIQQPRPKFVAPK